MLAIATLAVSLAAPVPKAKATDVYWPTKEGTKRVLECTVNGKTVETTETVTRVESKDGTHTVTYEVSREGKTVSSEFVVSAKGVFRTPPGGSEPAPEFQPTPGTTWTEGDSTHTVGKAEEVTVPAGTFKAIPLVSEVKLRARTYTYTTWFAPDVGVVKSVSPGKSGEMVQVLKEFTPGK